MLGNFFYLTPYAYASSIFPLSLSRAREIKEGEVL
jgi:hypothetical protein